MNCPNIYWIGNIIKMSKETISSHPTIGFVPARPLGWQGWGLKIRFKAAFLVFTGKADAVRWYE